MNLNSSVLAFAQKRERYVYRFGLRTAHDRQKPRVALASGVGGEFAYGGVRQDNRFIPDGRRLLNTTPDERS